MHAKGMCSRDSVVSVGTPSMSKKALTPSRTVSRNTVWNNVVESAFMTVLVNSLELGMSMEVPVGE